MLPDTPRLMQIIGIYKSLRPCRWIFNWRDLLYIAAAGVLQPLPPSNTFPARSISIAQILPGESGRAAHLAR